MNCNLVTYKREYLRVENGEPRVGVSNLSSNLLQHVFLHCKPYSALDGWSPYLFNVVEAATNSYSRRGYQCIIVMSNISNHYI